MSCGDDREDVLAVLIEEAGADLAEAQERVDALIDQTELCARPQLVQTLRRRGQEAGIPLVMPRYYRPKRQPTPLRREGRSVVFKPAHVIISGKERLTVQPVSPAGIKGMALLKLAAEIVRRIRQLNRTSHASVVGQVPGHPA